MMQNLFDVVSTNLFSILAAPNRAVYFRALMVLQACYQREITIHRSTLVTYLVSEMERDLYDFIEDEISDASDREASDAATSDEPSSLSSKAHALIRRFVETGWLQTSTDAVELDETLIVPPYAGILLDAFHSIVEPVQQRYNGFVYSVYSNLRTANDDRDEFMFQGLQAANDNTLALRENLRSLLHNIHSYYQNLHLRQEIRELLAEHFDSYQLSVAIAAYHPLKTFDSVYRFRPRILDILRNWLSLPSVLNQMTKSVRQRRTELDEPDARREVVQRITFIIDTFESLDDLLREIDKRHTSYNRASVERLQYLLNTDRDIKGKLVQLIRALPKVQSNSTSALLEEMRTLPIYQVKYLDSEALYRQPKKRVRGAPQPVVQQSTDDAAFRAEARELMERMNEIYSQKQIGEFILKQMKDSYRLASEDMILEEFDDFLRVIVAVVKGDESGVPYEIVWNEDKAVVSVGGYKIPLMTFVKKGAKV
ncbi:Wadjet anti-phage system protein JetA family protein [Alicyclobacillus sp. SO9]|uniref:Wadjet anti-phage system protein JetA family protein n=1 Tax=Alicyclobacillus sp. SO9 TaxID=2665646 RepID=UPI0018E7B67F|nr:Wadjet anti-phage system protein JetA family protein [Alicyclobacillus sp. SO9]QQE80526.1 hypothetical protein GI364_09020 [Alicyclobacillus sp. SO9]